MLVRMCFFNGTIAIGGDDGLPQQAVVGTYSHYRVIRSNWYMNINNRTLNQREAGMDSESDDPDLELQYIMVTKASDSAKLKDIENAMTAEVNMADEHGRQGILCINMLDLHTNKAVWQVTAMRAMALRPRPQNDINKDADYLFEEFPPVALLSRWE